MVSIRRPCGSQATAAKSSQEHWTQKTGRDARVARRPRARPSVRGARDLYCGRQVIERLLGANQGAAKVPGQDGDFALHIAVGNKAEMGVVRALIAAHPDAASSTNNDMDMPLHVAVANKASLDVVAALALAYPAAVSLTSSNITSSEVGWLPLEYAKAIADENRRDKTLGDEGYRQQLSALLIIEDGAYSSLDDRALRQYEKSLKTQTRVFGKSHQTLRSMRLEQDASSPDSKCADASPPGAGGGRQQLRQPAGECEKLREQEANRNMQMLLQEIMDEKSKEAQLAERKKGKRKKKKDKGPGVVTEAPAVMQEQAAGPPAVQCHRAGEGEKATDSIHCEPPANALGATAAGKSQRSLFMAHAQAAASSDVALMASATCKAPETASHAPDGTRIVHSAACAAAGTRESTPVPQVLRQGPQQPVVPGATVDQVCAWLVEVELGEYRDIFHANKIDGEMLQELEEEELVNDFGMANKYHRRRFLAKRSLACLAPALVEAVDKRECVICLGTEKEVEGWVILRPCGHVCVCTKCENGLDKCPVCRRDISEKFQAFL